MTVPQVAAKLTDKSVFNARLTSGDVLDVVTKDGQHFEITTNKMRAKERMILGIRLQPDAMDFTDWDNLPGIGPALAKSILTDLQKNGDFGSVEALRRVQGIGDGKLKEIKEYF
jgi:competence protein ComEA